MHEDYRVQPDDLPIPVDDGAADHLPGRPVPELPLPSTLGAQLNLGEATRKLTVVYIYPRTGVPGEPLPTGWDEIPGARGCTPQSCAFRDHVLEFAAYGASVVGLSAQPPAEQREFATREHIPYPLLSDPELRLAEALGLPTFEVAGQRFYRRLTFIARERRIRKVFYPIFPRTATPPRCWAGWHRSLRKGASLASQPAQSRLLGHRSRRKTPLQHRGRRKNGRSERQERPGRFGTSRWAGQLIWRRVCQVGVGDRVGLAAVKWAWVIASAWRPSKGVVVGGPGRRARCRLLPV